MARSNRTPDLAIPNLLHALALTHLTQSSSRRAIKLCRQSLNMKKRLIGSDHAEYYQTMELLATAYELEVEPMYGEILRNFIPTSFECKSHPPDVLDFITNHPGLLDGVFGTDATPWATALESDGLRLPVVELWNTGVPRPSIPPPELEDSSRPIPLFEKDSDPPAPINLWDANSNTRVENQRTGIDPYPIRDGQKGLSGRTRWTQVLTGENTRARDTPERRASLGLNSLDLAGTSSTYALQARQTETRRRWLSRIVPEGMRHMTWQASNHRKLQKKRTGFQQTATNLGPRTRQLIEQGVRQRMVEPLAPTPQSYASLSMDRFSTMAVLAPEDSQSTGEPVQHVWNLVASRYVDALVDPRAHGKNHGNSSADIAAPVELDSTPLGRDDPVANYVAPVELHNTSLPVELPLSDPWTRPIFQHRSTASSTSNSDYLDYPASCDSPTLGAQFTPPTSRESLPIGTTFNSTHPMTEDAMRCFDTGWSGIASSDSIEIEEEKIEILSLETDVYETDTIPDRPETDLTSEAKAGLTRHNIIEHRKISETLPERTLSLSIDTANTSPISCPRAPFDIEKESPKPRWRSHLTPGRRRRRQGNLKSGERKSMISNTSPCFYTASRLSATACARHIPTA
ncbi:hypothetical protein B0T26DRAFT_447316 [Lasiosphaeria miniovina]|uniref:Uncharacterized protein n=1 Tax=Lasiosphaeria miniovina TaxID=1954250 RepID=A0AA39ZZ60_9PEZI|nr:uncharacterized protein B0T26DRAFT_447316 [Lasiosphaeria miniovina]KAK0706317.1 hypothetical protein B0T26DRAFT_447316 [Lasiosphaeria miniovina]